MSALCQKRTFGQVLVIHPMHVISGLVREGGLALARWIPITVMTQVQMQAAALRNKRLRQRFEEN